jgi:endonuclease YncB( thermonuclease family)
VYVAGYGVDTPEIRGKCQYEKNLALKARDFVKTLLAILAIVIPIAILIIYLII